MDAKNHLLEVHDEFFVESVSVDLVWEPMWNRDMMSEEAQLELGMM